tara:strand:+ start:25757 stop:26398 length:642 start_codon:yes stop_codon:yes gene_type:complete
MKILFISDKSSWINPYIDDFISSLDKSKYNIGWTHNHIDIKDNHDLTFILSYSRIIEQSFLNLSKNNLVVHESDLPKGKGMSPLTWQVIEGKSEIPIVLFEAQESLDSGDIYLKDTIQLNGTELVEELRERQGKKTFELVHQFLIQYPSIEGKAQAGNSTTYEKRTPKDSELDIHKSIAEQFNLLRVCDNDKYPAFFIHHGEKYILKISKDYE